MIEGEMPEGVKIPPAPKVYCPKDREKVPVWYCLGSLTQGRENCPYLICATVHGAEWAKVECKWGATNKKVNESGILRNPEETSEPAGVSNPMNQSEP